MTDGILSYFYNAISINANGRAFIMIDAYEPQGPYVIKSGKKKGTYVEKLIFDDPGWLISKRNRLIREARQNDDLYKHLEWIFVQGETRRISRICPQCFQRTISYFSFKGSKSRGYSIGCLFTCCHDTACRTQLVLKGTGKKPTLLPVKLSSLHHFMLKKDKIRVAEVFRECFNLSKDASAEEIFNLFCA